MAYAHSPNAAGEWHDLVDHLRGVAELAREFAEPFGGGDLAYWAGLWHDLGKFHPDFQNYLIACASNPKRRPARVDHKGAGAIVAERAAGPLAFLIAGHHGGLHERADLGTRLNEWRGATRVDEALALARASLSIDTSGPLRPPAWVGTEARRLEFFLRMVFSCLVDADFLDTEAHFQSERAARRVGSSGIDDLWQPFHSEMQAKKRGKDGALASVRADVYQACLDAGALAPGLFRLTVPTGGGKTLAGMGFALAHAPAHGLERVIVAVPYTSITEQTAKVYRDIFGTASVLEHHSATPSAPDPDDTDGGPQWDRLAAENWDAPIVVTTTVRLFESLFSRKPSACRRLHRIANSVIILDEAQTLPSRLLAPILDVIADLTAYYHTSVVLCTATQPALDDAPGFRGLSGVREIVPEPARLYPQLRRVRFEWPWDHERWTWQRVASELHTAPQALAIVNTKADAQALLNVLDGDEVLHLSTLLCGAHRRDVLDEVRRRLKGGERCLLVSTQVVEAGVDLDFPLVLRAMGPLDRIVQAAGRCNREGRLPEGRVVVFEPAEARPLPRGDYDTGAGITSLMLRTGEIDPNDPATFTQYFQRLYDNVELDAERIQEHRAAFDYPEVAACFRMIDDEGTGILVRYRRDDGDHRFDEVLAQLRAARGMNRELRRAAQPFMVNVRTRLIPELQREGLLEELASELFLWRSTYDGTRGLMRAGIDPESQPS